MHFFTLVFLLNKDLRKLRNLFMAFGAMKIKMAGYESGGKHEISVPAIGSIESVASNKSMPPEVADRKKTVK